MFLKRTSIQEWDHGENPSCVVADDSGNLQPSKQIWNALTLLRRQSLFPEILAITEIFKINVQLHVSESLAFWPQLNWEIKIKCSRSPRHPEAPTRLQTNSNGKVCRWISTALAVSTWQLRLSAYSRVFLESLEVREQSGRELFYCISCVGCIVLLGKISGTCTSINAWEMHYKTRLSILPLRFNGLNINDYTGSGYQQRTRPLQQH